MSNNSFRAPAKEAFNEAALYGGKRGDREFDERYTEIFGELLVKQTLLLIKNARIDSVDPDSDYDLGHDNALDRIAEEIANYYGVSV